MPMSARREIEARADGTTFTATTADWSGRGAPAAAGQLQRPQRAGRAGAGRGRGDRPGRWRRGRSATCPASRVGWSGSTLGQPFGIVVDYAHTADSLAKVLRTLRPLTSGRLIVVFGSAGERDRTKRPAMGRVAAELADLTVVTDEDPRLEDGARHQRGDRRGRPRGRRPRRRDAVRHRRPPDGDRPRHRPCAGRRRDPAGRQGPREDDHLRHRGALVGREGGRSPGAARRGLRGRCLSSRALRVTDRDAWNAFVERAPYRSFPQLWEWGELREPSGWRPVRVAVGPDPAQPPLAGAQVLIRDVPLVGWRLGYAPRGPVGELDDAEVRDALTSPPCVRSARDEEIATLKVDPEATPDGPVRRRPARSRPGGKRPRSSRRARAWWTSRPTRRRCAAP